MPFIRVPDRYGKDHWINTSHIIEFWEADSADAITPAATWIALTNNNKPGKGVAYARISPHRLAITIAEAEADQSHG